MTPPLVVRAFKSKFIVLQGAIIVYFVSLPADHPVKDLCTKKRGKGPPPQKTQCK